MVRKQFDRVVGGCRPWVWFRRRWRWRAAVAVGGERRVAMAAAVLVEVVVHAAVALDGGGFHGGGFGGGGFHGGGFGWRRFSRRRFRRWIPQWRRFGRGFHGGYGERRFAFGSGLGYGFYRHYYAACYDYYDTMPGAAIATIPTPITTMAAATCSSGACTPATAGGRNPFRSAADRVFALIVVRRPRRCHAPGLRCLKPARRLTRSEPSTPWSCARQDRHGLLRRP